MNVCAQWGTATQWSAISRRLPRKPWERNAYNPDYTVRRREGSLTARAQQVLGEDGVARFHEFRSYGDGWDFGGGGSALRPQSVAAMERFLAIFDGFGESEPSLFLSRDGHLILAWEDATDERVEVDFGEDNNATLYRIVYGDDGRTFDLTREMAELIQAIPQ